jgi:hypothetical protein
MKIIESVKVVLEDPGHAFGTQIIAKIKGSGEDVDLTAMALVHWPIDIHIDGQGATVTLKMRVSELELHGFSVKAEEPDDGNAATEFVDVICSANAEHRSSTQWHGHGSRCDFGGLHSGVWMRVDMLTMDEK